MPSLPRTTSSDSAVLGSTEIVLDGPYSSTESSATSYKFFKLVSVNFKEAALDSPSFRASMNHLDLQLLNTEKWLIALTASMSKVPREVQELQGFLESFMEYLVPLFLQDGLLDQEYTVSSLNNTKDGLQMIWSLALGIININMATMDASKGEIIGRISAYKQLRRQFDAAQEKYDKFLSISMGLSKLKEPRMVLEDLLQVFAARKEYLKLSLDLSMEISEVSNIINERLNFENFTVWKDKMDKFGDKPILAELISEYWTTTKRIRTWSESYHKAMLNLSGDLLLARKHIEDRTLAQFAPSNLLSDYRTLLINSKTLSDVNETATEIHGYLFMKTWTDRSAKPIWVRRWAFIQSGVFGFLVLNPSQSSVQETDKIGVLLCNTKYSPNEDRRLCFEVKTMDTTLILQAETLDELKSWLKVFDNSRNRIINETDPMHDLFTLASGRYPPLVTEFLDVANTVTDKQITSSRIINKAGQIITSSKLSSHLEKSEKMFQSSIYNQIARIYLPFVTDASRSSLIAYSLTGSTSVPTALSANVWGSLNWGVYYMNDVVLPNQIEDDIPDEEFGKQIGNGISVPKNYPNTWLARDIQLRALFESTVDPSECCLVSFNCLLSPNSQQELRGTTFFTQKHLYSYIHSLGFVSLSKAPIKQFAAAQCTAKKNYDMLKIVNVQGSLRAKLFLDDGFLVAKKLNCLFENAASDKPEGLTGLIRQILKIESDHAAELKKAKAKRSLGEEQKSIMDASSEFKFVSQPTPNQLYRIDFSDEMKYLGEHVVKLPPKAVFHMFFGSRSTLLQESYPVVTVKISDKTKWMKDPINEKNLFREFVTDFKYYGSKSGRFIIRQELDGSIDNEYYSCKITRKSFKINYGPQFEFVNRIVLIGIENDQTRFKYYGGTITTDKSSPLGWFVERIGHTYSNSFFGSICRKLDEASKKIGNSGKVAKAIYQYGKIEFTDSACQSPLIPPSDVSIVTVIRLFYMGTMTAAARRFLVAAYFILSTLKTVLTRLSAHRFLVAIIGILSVMNILLGAQNTQYYFQAREARGLAREVLNYEPMMMQRAIYLKDIQELIQRNQLFAMDSTCFRTFLNTSFVLNYDQPSTWSNAYDDELSRAVAIKLRKSLQDIGIRRNELLVNLRMLNALEEEIARGEWKNWLMCELEKCDQFRHLLLFENGIIQDLGSGIAMLEEFCSSCAKEMDFLLTNQVDRV